jgi:hypothetical protein
MKVLFPLIMMLASCSGACVTAPPPPPQYKDPLTEGQYLATVRLVVECEDGRTILGSGVAISRTDVITARHVVFACDISSMTAVTLDGELEMRIQSASVTADAARLRAIDGKFQRYAGIYFGHVPVGAVVCSVGGDAHVQLMRKCGEVFAANEERVLTSIPAVPGNSGGPVFYGGYVAGIVSMGAWNPGSEKVQLYVPVGAFYDLLGVQ